MEAILVIDRSRLVPGLIDGRTRDAYRLARSILLDDDEAEDAVQDASLKAWLNRGSLRDGDRFDAWFDRILVNVCRDRLRRRRRLREIVPLAGPTPRTIDTTSAADVALDAAFDSLDADHRIVVLLRFWQDLPVDDIAGRLGIPAGTVKSRLHYALRAMRAHMEAS